MTPPTGALHELSALELANLIRRRALSSEEITRATLDRIEKHNDKLSAFVQILRDEAIRVARQKDRETFRSKGEGLPPFHGVPMGIKDLNFVAGAYTRMGSRAFANFVSMFDDRVTQNMRKAGFVIVGKTATSELGTLPVTEPDIHPPTRNPWNLDHTSGGSSGGAGSAVAAGLLPMAHGSDGAGSIRIPSAFCHLFGLKPSRGRVCNAYGLDDRELIYTCGPLARSVDDGAAFLDAFAGISSGVRNWAPAPVQTFHELSKRTPPRLRIKFARTTKLTTTHPDHAAAVDRFVNKLADLGHHVEDGGEISEGTVEEFLPVWQYAAANVPVLDWNDTQPVTRWLAEKGRELTAQQVNERRASLAARVLSWFGDVDLWITPTVAAPPPRVNAWSHLGPEEAFAEAAHLGPFTALFNLTGQPAASVPAGLSSVGLPIGIQVVGKPLADALVLQVSRQLEQEFPWTRIAPGWA
ncbi:MAG: amidase [Polyangiaceae bacterium]